MTDSGNSASIEVRILRVRPGFDDVPLPEYATSHAAGADIRAAIEDPITLGPGETVAVPTNLVIELPPGFEAQVRPRSGLALRFGILVPNSPGTIDSDFRGEIRIILLNAGKNPFTIARGDRIAQLILAPVSRIAWRMSTTLSETARGEGGFGHSGVS